MKSAEIEVGCEYVVALKPKHVLIPGTDVTYQERYAALCEMMPLGRRIPADVPQGARRELERLRGAVEGGRSGLHSRLVRCRHLCQDGAWGLGELVVTRKAGLGWFNSEILGVIVTVSEALGRQRYRVSADFIEERGGSMSLPDFDPSVPERADVDDEADKEAIDAWWGEHWNGLHDYAGTLEAVVHRAAFLWPWEDGLVKRLNAERQRKHEEARAYWEKRTKELQERLLDRRGAEIVDDAIARILTAEADDDWEALA